MRRGDGDGRPCLTKAELALIRTILRHCSLFIGRVDSRGFTNREYNAFRLFKRQDIPKLSRKYEKWMREYEDILNQNKEQL